MGTRICGMCSRCVLYYLYDCVSSIPPKYCQYTINAQIDTLCIVHLRANILRSIDDLRAYHNILFISLLIRLRRIYIMAAIAYYFYNTFYR